MQIHHLDGYIQSIYLVEYPHGLLLLDGCCRADVPTLEQYITEELERPFSDLKTVVVTHMHPDHAGAAHKLRKLSGCKIVSANKDNHWYRNWDGVLMHWTDILLALFVGRATKKPIKNLWYPRKLRPDVKLNDGDEVPDFNEWVIFETPGHTDRDLSVYHTPSEQVYIADLTVKTRKGYIVPFPLFHPNKYKESLGKIKDLKPKFVLLAHGGKQSPTIEDYEHLMSLAPDMPQTHWRARNMLWGLFRSRFFKKRKS